MADPYLVARMAAAGLSPDEAARAVDQVTAAVREQLAAGKTVRLDGIGSLVAPRKAVWVPGSVKRRAREERKVALRYPAIIEQGEPYDVR